MKIGVAIGVLAAGFLLLVWLLPAPPKESAPIPLPVPRNPAADFVDAEEDAVFEVEDLLADLASQLIRGAWAGALHAVDSDFEGSPFLRPPQGPSRDVGGVRLAEAGPDPRRLKRSFFGSALAETPLDRATFKIPAATLTGDRLSGTLKLDAYRQTGTAAVRWVAQGKVEFVRRNAVWRLHRFAADRQRTEEGAVRFLEATARLGLRTEYGPDDRDATQVTFGRLFLGGIAAGDFDGDGLTDLFVPEIGSARLFRNEGGRFRECAVEKGIAFHDAGSAALFLDTDNDGDLDLLVAAYEPEQIWDRRSKTRVPNEGHRSLSLYRNDGERFVDVTRAAGLEARGPAMGLCAADVDGDGRLDIYVSRYRDETKDDLEAPREIPPDVAGARDGEPNQLWMNRGDGTFREEAVGRGVADTGWGLAAAFADYDGDGKPDLYVANDYGTNRHFRNRGDGTFEDVTAKTGTGNAGFGMGVLWTDQDGDGDLDLYVSNMYSTAGNRILARGPGSLPRERHDLLIKMASGNTFFRNRGDGTFEEVTKDLGVGRAGWAWSSAAYDYENNGTPALYVTNGLRTSSFGVADL